MTLAHFLFLEAHYMKRKHQVCLVFIYKYFKVLSRNLIWRTWEICRNLIHNWKPMPLKCEAWVLITKLWCSVQFILKKLWTLEWELLCEMEMVLETLSLVTATFDNLNTCTSVLNTSFCWTPNSSSNLLVAHFGYALLMRTVFLKLCDTATLKNNMYIYVTSFPHLCRSSKS